MSEFGIGSQSGFDFTSSGPASSGTDLSSLGLDQGGGGFDQSGNDMGGGGWGQGQGNDMGGGGWGSVPPSAAPGSSYDPATQSAIQGYQQQPQQNQQQQQQYKDPHQNAIEQLFGNLKNALSPQHQTELQTLAAQQQGMGWFPGSQTPPQFGQGFQPIPGFPNAAPRGPQNDITGAIPNLRQALTSLAGGGGASAAPQTAPQSGAPTGDITGGAIPTPDAFANPAGSGQTDPSQGFIGKLLAAAQSRSQGGGADASTGNQATTTPPADTGATATPDVPELGPGFSADQPPVQTAGVAGEAGGPSGEADPNAPAPAPDTPPPQAAPAPIPPQSRSGSGNRSGQPAPGDMVSGSTSNAESYQGSYPTANNPRPWVNSPVFALADLLRGDFKSLMADLLGQQQGGGRQNQAGTPDPNQNWQNQQWAKPNVSPGGQGGADDVTKAPSSAAQAGVLPPPTGSTDPQTAAATPTGTQTAPQNTTPQPKPTPVKTTTEAGTGSAPLNDATNANRNQPPTQNVLPAPSATSPQPLSGGKTADSGGTITYAPHTKENPGNVPIQVPAPLNPQQSYNASKNPATQTPPTNSPQAVAAREQAGTSPVQKGPPSTTTPPAGFGATRTGAVGRANATRPRDTHGLTGHITVGGQTFSFGSGGVNNHFSLPYGQYYLHDAAHGGIGPTGQRIGAIAGISDDPRSGNTVGNDPRTGSSRVGVEIHPSRSGYTEGCIGVNQAQWSAFSQAFQQAARQYGGNLILKVNPDGSASIEGAGSTMMAGP